jgi:hypothetical protein
MICWIGGSFQRRSVLGFPAVCGGIIAGGADVPGRIGLGRYLLPSRPHDRVPVSR